MIAYKLNKLCKNYDFVTVYQLGAPKSGVNADVLQWAFENCYPVKLGELRFDKDAMVNDFAENDEKAAVVLFKTELIPQNENADYAEMQRVAQKLAAIYGVNLYIITDAVDGENPY
jgi:hypothetical protein